MKIVVVGGTGLIGSKVVRKLAERGHEAMAASRATGVNSYTGEGLADALRDADSVVDVSDSPSYDEAGALEFFETSTLNLITYGAAAGVRHHVGLSVVGTDRLAKAEGGYFRAKDLQETLVSGSVLPYTLVHATQFFEFLHSIADSVTVGNEVRLARARVQPMAAEDVATAVAAAAIGTPANRIIEFAGPEQFTLEDIVRRTLHARHDPRAVLADPLATYFGATLDEHALLPSADATLATTRYGDWLNEGAAGVA